MGEMGFPAEYLNAGQRSPLACADGYQFQRADGRDGVGAGANGDARG